MNKQCKHILLVIRHPVGGIRTYMRYVFNQPVFMHFKFTIILPESGLTEAFIDSLKVIKPTYISCDDSVLSMTKVISLALREQSYDLIHSHGFTSGVCSVLPAKLFSVQHLMTSHDVLLDEQFKGVKGSIKKKVLSVLFGMVDKIQSVTHDANDNFKKMFPSIEEKRLVTIVNGIDVSEYNDPTPRDIKSELELPNDSILIGFLGRFMSQKGFKYIIEAIEILSKKEGLSKKPIVIAVGDDGFIREEQAVIQNKGLENNFYFLPPVSHAGSTMKGMDVIAMPSLWEACGLLAMEALILGVPLIVSNCMGLREVVFDSPAFVVEPRNAEQLADVIEQCIVNNRMSLFEEYKNIARGRFDCKHTARQLNSVYESMFV